MKIVFLSNYYNHHQKSISLSFDRLTRHQYQFIETSVITEERKQMGWGEQVIPDFVVPFSQEFVDEAEVVMLGSAPIETIEDRLLQGKLTFLYTERLFKQGYQIWKWPIRVIRFWQRYTRHKEFYLLSASAYTAYDFGKHYAFQNKAYKWGYFPETKHYDIAQLLSQKKKTKILWCGRFIDWKHPDDVIEVAKRLKQQGYSFDLDMIGVGEMEATMRDLIDQYQLSDCVHLLGAMKPEEVRTHMEEAGIYLFTSDFNEGWGAVLNESMNSGCAVVASHAIGSVPFLMKHKENGLIYQNGNLDDLFKKVKYLLDHPSEQERMGRQAYHTIVDLWNAEVAAERFLRLAEYIKDHGYCDLYQDGPCSPAPIIKNYWF